MTCTLLVVSGRGLYLNCKDCIHWGETENDTSSDNSYIRFCRMIMSNLRPNSISIGADDDYNLQCMTHAFFGCKLFEQK